MKAFRLLALGYAMLALLIAPAWPAAEESPVSTVPEAVEDPVGEVDEETRRRRTRPTIRPSRSVTPASEPRPRRRSAPPSRSATLETTAKADRSRDTRDGPAANAAQSGSVTMTDFEFTPATITVR